MEGSRKGPKEARDWKESKGPKEAMEVTVNCYLGKEGYQGGSGNQKSSYSYDEPEPPISLNL